MRRTNMRILYIILSFLLITSTAWAERHYVFIDKIGKVSTGHEAGQTEKGDIVAIVPFRPQFRPTKAELARYKIIVVDFTNDKEISDLLDGVPVSTNKDEQGNQLYDVVSKARQRKIDIDNVSLRDVKQEAEVDKMVFKQRIIDKSVIAVPR